MPNNLFSRISKRISLYTIKLLNSLLPIILLEFIWFGVSFIIAAKLDPLGAIAHYRPIIEHLMTSLLITIGGAILFDISMHEQGRK